MGARDEKAAQRAVWAGLRLCLLLVGPPLLASFFCGVSLVRIFVDDAEAIRLGNVMFQVVGPSVLLFSLYFVLTGAFQGSGDTKVIMALAIIRLWGIRVPLAYALARFTALGPVSIWVGMFASNLVTAVAGFLWFRGGRWRRALKAEI